MNVKELIEILKWHDQDLELWGQHESGSEYHDTITTVSLVVMSENGTLCEDEQENKGNARVLVIK